MKKRYALISVSDYTHLTELARELSGLGFTLIASLGNAIYLEKRHVTVTRIQKITKYRPMIMPRGIKSIHHLIFAGILADRKNRAHMRDVRKHHIVPFDVVVCNFYPFERMVAEGAPDKPTMQSIDIGGPAMVRCAAKNYTSVAVITDPRDYAELLGVMKQSGALPVGVRRALAVKAFKYTRDYDAAIVKYLTKASGHHRASAAVR